MPIVPMVGLIMGAMALALGALLLLRTWRTPPTQRQLGVWVGIAVAQSGAVRIATALAHGESDQLRLLIASGETAALMLCVPMLLREWVANFCRNAAPTGGPTEGDLVRFRPGAVLGAIGTAGMGLADYALAEGDPIGWMLAVVGVAVALGLLLWMRGLTTARLATR